MPIFPTSLPAPVWRDVRLASPIGALQVTDMEVGPAKRRRRTTTSPKPVSLSISPVTAEMALEFEAFYSDGLEMGALSFSMDHPVYGVVGSWRFIAEDAYEIVPIGDDALEISMTLEMLS